MVCVNTIWDLQSKLELMDVGFVTQETQHKEAYYPIWWEKGRVSSKVMSQCFLKTNLNQFLAYLHESQTTMNEKKKE